MSGIVGREEWHETLRDRRSDLWRSAADADCDTLLVYGATAHMEPFRYVTNFAPVLGDGYAILTSEGTAECVLNFDWQLPEAREASAIDDWTGLFDAPQAVADRLRAIAPRTVGVIGLHRLPHLTMERLRSAAPGAEWVDLGADLNQLRRIKTDMEVRLLAEAGRITDAAMNDFRDFVRVGQTEHELAARLAFVMHSHGAGLAFEPTVITGDDNPMTIRMPTDRRVQPGDAVMIDIGAMVAGYQADAARTFVMGEPSERQIEVWTAVVGAYEAALENTKPGVPAHTLHDASRAVIEDAGFELVHRIGHGIGLATSFEWPSLDTESAPLEAGMTFCIEPGIYVKGAGNMKLEDDLVVTDDGYRLLTHAPRGLDVPAR